MFKRLQFLIPALLGVIGIGILAYVSLPGSPTAQPAAAALTPSLVPHIAPPPHIPGGETAASVMRIKNPYARPPDLLQNVSDHARDALVNILCISGTSSLSPSSGSGVIIDPRGVILTSAHVAQYVLLAQSGEVEIECMARSGEPAALIGSVEVLFIPPSWVAEHAMDLREDTPQVTGEHDYALLLTFATSSLPYMPFDTREAIGFLGDDVVVAAYPAEFVGAEAAKHALFPASSVTTIRDLLTFGVSTVDMMSMGGVIEAQSGSSGGPVANAWGYLVGLITTTGAGATAPERDMRALTISYIDRDLIRESGLRLTTMISGDIGARAEKFNKVTAPALEKLLLDQLRSR